MRELTSVASRRPGGTHRYRVLECPDCGFVQAEGPDDPAILEEIYTGGFHDSLQQTADVEPNELFSRRSRRFPVIRNATERANWLRELGLVGTLLDVGAGKGYFVKAAQRYFDARGMELSSDAAAKARALGANVVQGDFTAVGIAAGRFDVITLWDVLAGFRDPHLAMAKLAALLKPGGTLVFTVPLASSTVARICGRHWPLLIPPVNLSYFSPESLERLLVEHGLERIDTCFAGKRVACGFLLIKLMRAIGLGASAPVAVPGWIAGISVRVNLRDILTVIARKPPALEA